MAGALLPKPTVMEDLYALLPAGASRLPSGAVLLDGAHRIGRESHMGGHIFGRDLAQADTFLAIVAGSSPDLRVAAKEVARWASLRHHLHPSGAVTRFPYGEMRAVGPRTRVLRWDDGSVNLHHHGRLLPFSWCSPDDPSKPAHRAVARRLQGHHLLPAESSALRADAALDDSWFALHAATWNLIARSPWRLAWPFLSGADTDVLTPWWLETSGWRSQNGPALEAGLLHALDIAGVTLPPDANVVFQAARGDLHARPGAGTKRGAKVTLMGAPQGSMVEAAIAEAIQGFGPLQRVMDSHHLFVHRHHAVGRDGATVRSVHTDEALWGARIGQMTAHARMAGLHALHALDVSLPAS